MSEAIVAIVAHENGLVGKHRRANVCRLRVFGDEILKGKQELPHDRATALPSMSFVLTPQKSSAAAVTFAD